MLFHKPMHREFTTTKEMAPSLVGVLKIWWGLSLCRIWFWSVKFPALIGHDA